MIVTAAIAMTLHSGTDIWTPSKEAGQRLNAGQEKGVLAMHHGMHSGNTCPLVGVYAFVKYMSRTGLQLACKLHFGLAFTKLDCGRILSAHPISEGNCILGLAQTVCLYVGFRF